MGKEYFFEKISELKERFKSFFQHRKKIAALENFSAAGKFPHRKYLFMVKECLNDGFLGEKEADFLDHMLSRYELNYLDWAHKTRWIKSQIAKKAEEFAASAAPQFIFNFEKKEATPVHVPLELLSNTALQASKRA